MDPLVCYCFCVTEKTVREAIRTHRLRTVLEVVEHTNAGMGCRGCWFDIEEMLEQFWSSPEAELPDTSSDDSGQTTD
jgi:NAD(P)H-nitrite reductase large subunit